MGELDHTRYTLYESLILPISAYLRSEGVDFHINTKVVDVRMDSDGRPKGEPSTVTEILLREYDEEQRIKIEANDILIATVGSPNSGGQLGTNSEPVPKHPDPDDFTYGDWSLWFHLAQKSPKFGDPLNFNSHIQESTMVTFTTTLYDSEFLLLYRTLTHDYTGIRCTSVFP